MSKKCLVVGMMVWMAGMAVGQPGTAPAKPQPAPTKTQPAPAKVTPPPTKPAPAPQPDDNNGGLLFADPEMVFDKTLVEIGKIDDSEPVEVEFKFTNRGVGTLVISNVSSTCGCTVPQLTKREYGPGESGVIKATFDPKNRPGQQHKSITVASNDGRNPTMSLTLTADVVPNVRVDPQQLMLEPVQKGQSRTKLFKVFGRKPGFEVTAVRALPETMPFKVRVLETKDVEIGGEKQREVTVEVSLPAGSPVGQFFATLDVTTNEAKGGSVKAGVSGEVLGDLQVTPQRVSLGVVQPGQSFAGEVKISRRDGKPVKILKAEVKPLSEQPVDVTAALTSDAAGTMHTIKLSGVAPAGVPRYSGELLVTTDVPGEEMVRIQTFLTIRPGAAAPTGPAPAKSITKPGEVVGPAPKK